MQDLIKFITQELVQFISMPREERAKKKQERKELQGHWSEHWFGMLPTAVRMLFRNRSKH